MPKKPTTSQLNILKKHIRHHMPNAKTTQKKNAKYRKKHGKISLKTHQKTMPWKRPKICNKKVQKYR